jgi:uncharacterized membrane protein
MGSSDTASDDAAIAYVLVGLFMVAILVGGFVYIQKQRKSVMVQKMQIEEETRNSMKLRKQAFDGVGAGDSGDAQNPLLSPDIIILATGTPRGQRRGVRQQHRA